jgi:ELP3 family radical SAM enzyme/protein acetyltransferase
MSTPTLLQEKCFLEFYEMFHDRLSTTTMNDFEHVNQILNGTIRTALTTNKGAFNTMPSKSDLLKVYQSLVASKRLVHDNIIETLLTTRVVRSSSGVLPISIALDGRKTSDDMEEGFSCAYDCAFCPNECVANGAEKDIARSYLSSEGTFIRGAIQNFSTKEQVWRRLAELEVMGHVPDKLEVIPLGGTWDCYPRSYRERFSRELFYAANTYSLISIKYKGKFTELLKKWLSKKPFQNNMPLDPIMCEMIRSERPMLSLEEEKSTNTKSQCCRIVGLVFETRPDRINRVTLLEKRRLGCTRIQLGIQHTDNDVLHFNNRGHDVRTTVRAIRASRDAGYKVDGHIMPDLPFTTVEKDYEMVRDVFLGTDLQLDYCKVYPCLDLPFTLARKWKEEGTWKPYAEHNFPAFLEMLCYTLSIVPPWVRVNRVQRDFPEASVKNNGLGYVSDTIKTNLHQIVDQEMAKKGQKCYDIRSREIKNTMLTEKQFGEAKLYIRTYRANEGTEFFISVEVPKNVSAQTDFDDTQLLGLARLRLLDQTESPPTHLLPTFRDRSRRIARLRELHVYGTIAGGGSTSTSQHKQHRGIGKFLVGVAEAISGMYGFDTVAIISGVGVRDYYERLGYKLGEKEDEYMMKHLATSVSLPMELFGKSYDIGVIQRTLNSSIVSKKYLGVSGDDCSFCDIFNPTISKTHMYSAIQNGEAQGFSFSVSRKTTVILQYFEYIFMFLVMITFIHCMK